MERNRARRLGREAYRHLRQELKPGYDLVLLVYPGNADFGFRMKQLRELLGRAGLFDRIGKGIGKTRTGKSRTEKTGQKN